MDNLRYEVFNMIQGSIFILVMAKKDRLRGQSECLNQVDQVFNLQVGSLHELQVIYYFLKQLSIFVASVNSKLRTKEEHSCTYVLRSS